MDLENLRKKLQDNAYIKKFFTNKNNKKNSKVSWKELIDIFGKEADSHNSLKVNKYLARCHIEMHNTAFNSIWGLKYYPQILINMYTLARFKNVYLTMNVAWVLGTNMIAQKMAYFQLWNQPFINIRKFYDFSLSKEPELIEHIQVKGR